MNVQAFWSTVLYFPAFRGGLLWYADADAEGLESIVSRLSTLETQHGERFAPAGLLVEMSEKGTGFYA